ncbi:MAG: transposase [Azonexaceae bacterium]|nr:transposase [Azonexaceae bacterium]
MSVPATGTLMVGAWKPKSIRLTLTGIESFWSYAKFRLIKLHGVRPEFFFLHLKESEWRWRGRP